MSEDNPTLAHERDAKVEQLRSLAAKDAADGLTDEESAQFDALEADVRNLNTRIERSNRAASIAQPELRSVVREQASDENAGRVPHVEARDRNPGHHSLKPNQSWFRDLMRAGRGDIEARRRLEETDRYTRGAMEARDLSAGSASAGGELVPPLYLQDMFAAKREAAAVVASIANQQPLPDAGASVTIPVMDGSTAAADHTEGAAIQETDATFTHATATVKEAAGLQTLSLMLVERSAPGADAVILDNLARRVAIRIDNAAITAITGQSGIQAVTYTDASPTLAEFYPKLADAIQQIHSEYFDRGNLQIVAHPRRWGKWISEQDSSGRPLITPVAPMNPLGGAGMAMAAEGVVGNMQGYNVLLDANIPTTGGAGTNEDTVLVGDFSQLYLWLGMPTFETSVDSKFGTGQVQVRARQYYAVSAGVFPAAFGKITGTGLAAPTF